MAAERRRQGRPLPNILLILSDDQGWGDLSVHGNPLLPTPNLDRLAADSVEFTRFHVSPVCAPTRASLLTGRYHLRCGVHGVTGGRETMRASEMTLAEALLPAGYGTALLGKWHLGENFPYVPHAQGFEEFIGFRTGHWYDYWDPKFERNGKPHQLKGYVTESLTGEAIRYIDERRREPFFLYMAYNVPHSPFQVPERYWSRFRDLAGVSRETAAAYALTACLDDQVGRLLRHLDERKLAEDTIVLFLGDNGPNTDRFTGGLRGRKGSVYEGGTRSPLLVRWPGRLKAGKKVDRIAAHIDVFPTLLDLAGVERPKGPALDGVTLRPLLEGDGHDWPERMLFTHGEPARNPGALYPGAARTQRFNLVNGRELYDVAADPGETKNVADAYPERAAELKAAYEAWFADVMKPYGLVHFPVPVGYAEENPAVLTATQARLIGQLKYFQGAGWAHDWASGWTAEGDAMSWDLDVVKAGEYEIELTVLCPEEVVGTRLSVQVGSSAAVEWVMEQPSPAGAVAMRDVVPRKEAPVMRWAHCRAGVARVAAGRMPAAIRYVAGSGKSGLGVYAMSLRRLDSKY